MTMQAYVLRRGILLQLVVKQNIFVMRNPHMTGWLPLHPHPLPNPLSGSVQTFVYARIVRPHPPYIAYIGGCPASTSSKNSQ